MFTKRPAKSPGFTLIEIVLVLAIAGLILIIVFLGVAGAQRNRRDSVRKTDLNRLASQVETFAGNHDGNYPPDLSSASDWGASGTYTPSNFSDPLTDTSYFTIGYTTGATPGAAVGSLSYQLGGTGCDGSALSGKQFMLQIRLEQGVDCVDNR
jgi:prepilin-type N-terminal cleavage/methylation domain-containing protein